MLVGIISDIHGDVDALNTVLDRLDNIHKVDHIICAGDLVGRGPDPNAVVTCIRERGIPAVKGNHDEWPYELSPKNTAYLKALPIDWEGEFNGAIVFMCHGKPGNNLWGMYRDHLSDTYVNMMLYDLDVDVIVTGHTHMPLYIRVENGCLVNPGSIYTFSNIRPTSHTYGVLHLPNMALALYDVNGSNPGRPISLQG